MTAMYGSGYIFSKPFFTGWVVVGIIWIFGSLFGVGLFPIFEGRKTLVNTVKFIYLDITGKKHPSKHTVTIEAEGGKSDHEGHEDILPNKGSGDVTPTEK